MQIKQSTIVWCLIIAAGCFLISMVGNILMPFIFGTIVAYFLDPVVDRLEERNLSRNLSTIIILAIFAGVLIGFIMLFGPLIFNQISDLISKIPEYSAKLLQDNQSALRVWVHRYIPEIEGQTQDIASKYSGEILKVSTAIASGIFTSGKAVFNILSLILVSPIVAYYLLRDWDVLVKKIDDLMPREKLSVIRRNFKKIDEIISAYIRGQLSVCIIMGLFYAISLTIVGLNYGFAIGFLTGIFTFIPYIGMAVGAITGVIVAYMQFGFEQGMWMTIFAFVIGNMIEGNFVSPRLIGNSVELHPAWIIFALLAGGSVMGFTGILIAIPVAAVVGVLTRSTVDAYKHSELYLGYSAVQLTHFSHAHQEGVLTDKLEMPVLFDSLPDQSKPDQQKATIKMNKQKSEPASATPSKKKIKKKKKKKEPELKFNK